MKKNDYVNFFSLPITHAHDGTIVASTVPASECQSISSRWRQSRRPRPDMRGRIFRTAAITYYATCPGRTVLAPNCCALEARWRHFSALLTCPRVCVPNAQAWPFVSALLRMRASKVRTRRSRSWDLIKEAPKLDPLQSPQRRRDRENQTHNYIPKNLYLEPLIFFPPGSSPSGKRTT